MVLSEIINRPQNEDISTQESLFVIQEYVRIRKGRVIRAFIPHLHPVIIKDQLIKMIKLRDHAINWFKLNNYE